MESGNKMNAGSESNCVHEQVAKADCECPIYITYTNVNGYLIPNLTYKSGEQMEQLGKYGFLRRDYLKNHRNSTYQVMLLQDTIGEHLLEVDKAAREREEVILEQLEEKEPLPDKEKDQMAWVRAANQHRAIAEEIILKELIYA